MLDPLRGKAAMSRQINLYSPAFRHQPKTFSAVWTAAAVIIIAAGMSAFYAWEAGQLPALRPRRSEAEAQLKQLREQIVALGQTTQKTRNKALEDQVARAEITLKSRQEFFGRLQSGEFGNRDGYAKFLAALARQRLEGVWLTGIEVSGPGSDFAIEGRTIRADLLPGFIRMLRNEEALRGKPIGTLALHEREIDPKGEQKAQAGPAGTVPAPGQGGGQGAQAGPAGQPSPGVLVVEFTIGTGATGVATVAGGTGR
jgi:hypothetical protein